MLINEYVAIKTSKIFLVPYSAHHVPVYHEWMKDPEIQVATASEPLSISEEYAMQKSWRTDVDKLTFITCQPFESQQDGSVPTAEIAHMTGDVNLFVSTMDEEDDDEDPRQSLVGEIELMIAQKQNQLKGLGRASLLAFLCYIYSHETEIVREFQQCSTTPSPQQTTFDYLRVKINESNTKSINLFQSIGFEKIVATPNYFGEYEMRHLGLGLEQVKGLLADRRIEGYTEVEYIPPRLSAVNAVTSTETQSRHKIDDH